jgi:predicted amino acid racemase
MIQYECIISRYNEYIDFVKEIIPLVDIIIIYNKGFNQNFFKEYVPTPEHLQKIKIINLE